MIWNMVRKLSWMLPYAASRLHAAAMPRDIHKTVLSALCMVRYACTGPGVSRRRIEASYRGVVSRHR